MPFSRWTHRIIRAKKLKSYVRSKGYILLDSAKKELGRIIDNLIEEAMLSAQHAGRKRINSNDIRRCQVCDKDPRLGPLKL